MILTYRRMVAMSRRRDRVRLRMEMQWEARAGHRQEAAGAVKAEAYCATGTLAVEGAIHAGLCLCQCRSFPATVRALRQKQLEIKL